MSTLFLLAWMAQEAPPQEEAGIQKASEEADSSVSTPEADSESVVDTPVESAAADADAAAADDADAVEGAQAAEGVDAASTDAEVVVVEPEPPRAPDFSLERGKSGASLYASANNRWNRHQVGSLVTVMVADDLTTSVTADTIANQQSDSEAKVGALLGITTSILGNNPNMLELDDGEIGVTGGSMNNFTGNGTTSRQNNLQGSLTCTVVEVQPNGNLVLEGHKVITVNGETQVLVVHGIARPMDVKGDNTIESRFLADPTIQVTGNGTLDDKQHPGGGNRLLSRFWPF